MKAWLIDSLGGIDKLRLADVPDPEPGPGEVLLDVTYAALNPADRYLAEGQYPARPPLPHVLGRDGVGVARALGDGLTGIDLGRHYTLLRGEAGVDRWGTFAERVVVPVESLVPVPDGWTLEQASCAALVYVTAHQAIRQWDDLPRQAVLLITGASGGVGVAATQLAAAMGHTVVALSRSEAKQRTLKQLGATAALDPHDTQWRRRLKEQLHGRRVDLAIDNIGGALFSEVIDALADRGRVSCVGRLAGPVPQFNTASLFFRRIKVGGVAVASYTNTEARAAWGEIVAMLDGQKARPVVDRVVSFGELPEAFRRLAEGPMGKVVVAVHPE